MKATRIEELTIGVYKIKWKGGGSSLASIGCDAKGRWWMAPCNWINMDKTYIDNCLEGIKYFKLIKAKKW